MATELFDSDKQAIADALRRDMRAQEELATHGGPEAQLHGYWARQSKQLLQIIMPKHTMPR
jgi:hypothetical protein